MTKMSFVTAESGAVTVDWVVLTAAAAGVALATLGLLGTGVAQTNRTIETEMNLVGTVGETWAAAMRNYKPHDTTFHAAIYSGLSSLSDEDLDEMERLVNDLVNQLTVFVETDEDQAVLNDLTFAVGLTYSERVRKRPNATGADLENVERIMTAMGWDQETLVNTN